MYSHREEGRNHLRKSMSPISQFVAETLRVKTILEYIYTDKYLPIYVLAIYLNKYL